MINGRNGLKLVSDRATAAGPGTRPASFPASLLGGSVGTVGPQAGCGLCRWRTGCSLRTRLGLARWTIRGDCAGPRAGVYVGATGGVVTTTEGAGVTGPVGCGVGACVDVGVGLGLGGGFGTGAGVGAGSGVGPGTGVVVGGGAGVVSVNAAAGAAPGRTTVAVKPPSARRVARAATASGVFEPPGCSTPLLPLRPVRNNECRTPSKTCLSPRLSSLDSVTWPGQRARS
jgi:hypothetical protein